MGQLLLKPLNVAPLDATFLDVVLQVVDAVIEIVELGLHLLK